MGGAGISAALSAHSGLGYLGIHAVQYAAQPLLTRRFVHPMAITSSLVMVAELIKFCGCVAMLVGEGRLRVVLRGWDFRATLVCAGLPAVTYAVQNICIQIAYQNLDGVVFNIVNQTKMIFTALFVFLVMRRGQSRMQCVALCLLFIAAAIVTLSQTRAKEAEHNGHDSRDPRLGIACIFLASSLSGLGAAISEWALQRAKRDSYLFSAELAALSFFAVAVNVALDLNGDGARAQAGGLFNHWDAWTFVPNLTQGLGGIVVGLITKVSGSVRKGFAVIVGLILSSFFQRWVSGTPLPSSLTVAVPLVALSVYLHASYPPAPVKTA